MEERRAKRQKIDKTNKFAAFQKLKELKGQGVKNKYELTVDENVYEEVSEREYTERVLKRQEDDWIDDDGEDGYVEDGREIFDDDIEDVVQEKEKHKKKKNKNIQNPAGSGNIQKLLSNMPVKKKKKEDVQLSNDDVLADLLSEVTNTEIAPTLKLNTKTKEIIRPKEDKKLSAKEYLANFSKPIKVEKSVVTPSIPVEQNTHKIGQVEVKTENIEMNEIEDRKTEKPEKNDLDDEVWEQMQIDDWYVHADQGGEPMTEETQGKLQIETFDSQCLPVKSEVIETENVESPLNEVEEIKTVVKKELSVCAEWESVQKENFSPPTDSPVLSRTTDDSIPLALNHENKKVFRMFYLDAFEDIYKQPGTVYLFGKVFIKESKSYVSCCVIVQNIERKIYLLPRSEHLKTKEPVTIAQVYAEFDEVATKYKILDFKSRKIEKKYAFNLPGVPDLSEYLEVRYSAKCTALPSDLSGDTFSHVFGTKTSFLENLLLEQKIKGPSWIEFEEAEKFPSRISWCKYEILCNKMENIFVSQVENLTPPPLVIAAINVQTATNAQKQNEIIAIGCLVHTSFPLNKTAPSTPFNQHFCVVNKPSDMTWPYDNKEIVTNRYANTTVEKMNSERALLNFFLTKLSNIDPDLIVGHDILNFDIEVLLSRINAHKVPQWSRLCRIRRGNELMGLKIKSFNAMSGRLVCDVKVSAMELIRARSYDLETLCQQCLHINHEIKTEFSSLEVREMFKNSKSIVEFLKFTMLHTSYILKIMCELNVLPLAIQITNICGNILSRTLMGGRSERNEFLLLHAFHEKSYVLPDKQYGKPKKEDGDEVEAAPKGKRKKAAYSGGLVLEPKKGFYDKFIILMDFNSLYPSIIQEYNICFTTIPVRILKDCDIATLCEYIPEQQVDTGILPSEIKKLVESRRQVKGLMKQANLSADVLLQYDIRQKALKLTANSMYGCLGFPNSRFFAQPLAALVTAKGREILVNTKTLVENLNYEVIYGDTDSLMISCNVNDFDSVFKIGNQIKSECNKLYKQLEIDIDGVYKYMLLLKKKKYAALSISKLPNGKMVCSQEIKGVDVVRRDWSQLASEAGKFVISQILDEASYTDYSLEERLQNIHEHMKKIRTDLDAGTVPLTLLEITKQLTKAPEDYTDKKALPHVQVALRVNATSTKKLKQGDTISYIICEDGTSEGATQRAYSMEELKNNSNLKVDINYYLSQQIHPVVTRLLEPIDGTDAVRIAECLGLDTSQYKQQIKDSIQESEENILGVGEAEEVKYQFCDKFEFTCINESCKKVNEIDGSTRLTKSGVVFVLDQCANESCTVAPHTYLPHLVNKLTQVMNKYISKYYEGWLKCEDPGCNNLTRRCPLGLKTRLCTACHKYRLHRVYTELQLYQQLSFFHYMFDITKALTKPDTPSIKFDSPTYLSYCKVKQHIDMFLESSAYNIVDLKKLFSAEEKSVKDSRAVVVQSPEDYEFDFDLEYSDLS